MVLGFLCSHTPPSVLPQTPLNTDLPPLKMKYAMRQEEHGMAAGNQERLELEDIWLCFISPPFPYQLSYTHLPGALQPHTFKIAWNLVECTEVTFKTPSFMYCSRWSSHFHLPNMKSHPFITDPWDPISRLISTQPQSNPLRFLIRNSTLFNVASSDPMIQWTWLCHPK